MTSVDVIVPCFNYGEFLCDCVTSVLAQAGVQVRVLIMDDASTDDTQPLGRALAAQDARVEYHRHDVNLGHIATYNEALAMVTAPYCVILSADDLLTPGSLQRATSCMDAHPDVGLVYGEDVVFRGPPPSGAVRDGGGGARVTRYLEFLEDACRRGHTGIQAPTALVRSSVHRLAGGYRPDLPHSGDTEIWLRYAVRANIAALDAQQAYRRVHDANMSWRYSVLGRLEAQAAAFEVHFREHAPSLPEVSHLHLVARRTIAESAFWRGAEAFREGHRDACEALLQLAVRLWPGIVAWPPWRRFRWTRRLGVTAGRWMEPAARRMRDLVKVWRPARGEAGPP